MGAFSQRLTGSQLYEWLRLKGYVAFDAPRATTALGVSLLLGIAAAHCYVLMSRPGLPAVFGVYIGLVSAGCLMVAAAMTLRRSERIARIAWLVGDVIAVTFLGVYFGTRPAVFPGFSAITGRWDFAPGTLAGALALFFIAVHASVLFGINVAYPRHQHWSD